MPLLSACLIVRDEASRIGACLDALLPVVDEVVVHDTGSTDGTVALLRAAGVIVIEGTWTDDFAAARNVALARARGEWVLSIDADEVLVAERDLLRRTLGRTPSRTRALDVQIHNAGADGDGYSHPAVRLFRRRGASWAGRLHERVEHPGAHTPAGSLPPDTISLQHSGYADPQTLRRKSERNVAIAQAEIDALLATGGASPVELAVTAHNLGRAATGAQRAQLAVDSFEAVRDLVPPGTSLWLDATDHLVRLLIVAGELDIAEALAEQLRTTGGHGSYCDWLRAQAIAATGRAAEALALLTPITQLVDTAGRTYDVTQVRRLEALCRELLAAAPQPV